MGNELFIGVSVRWFCLSRVIQGTSKNLDFISTAALRKKFLAYISSICGAAKFFPRLAFERTLNF